MPRQGTAVEAVSPMSRMPWAQFVARRARQNQAARVVATFVQATPSQTAVRVERDRLQGLIDDESYCVRMEALGEVRQAYRDEGGVRGVDCTSEDWVSLGNGGHMRRNHIH
jgi:hypothetical protein